MGESPAQTGAWRRSRGIEVVGIAALYFLAAQLGLLLAFERSNASPVWPPSGIAFTAALIFGARAWPAVAVGAFAANAVVFAQNHAGSTAAIVLASCSIAGGNAGEAAVGALLGRRFFRGSGEPLERTANIFAFTCVALVMSLISATVGAATVCCAAFASWANAGTIWLTWWLGDAAGVIVTTPLLLSLWGWVTRSAGGTPVPRTLEATGMIAALCLIGATVFWGWLDEKMFRRQAYALIPILLWSAFRFGRVATTGAVTIASGIAIWGTIHGHGPFSAGSRNESLLLLQVYVCVLSLTTLSISALLTERERREQELRDANESLEGHVAERTADIARMNEDLRGANAELEERTAELRRRSEEVEAFVYSVSHDLRAPLVNVQGFCRELELSTAALTDHLREVELPPAIRREVAELVGSDIPTSLRFIKAGASRSERLINALLALSRSGREELRVEVVDVEALARATIDAMQALIAAKGAKVTVSPLPGARGDATAIGRVLSNLLQNALNYLRPGVEGVIEVGGEARGEESEYWVSDNGSGLSASAFERLFRVFQRFHPKLAQGEGMGLAIIKRIVERQGGRVWAESVEGRGSTFRFTLPGADRP